MKSYQYLISKMANRRLQRWRIVALLKERNRQKKTIVALDLIVPCLTVSVNATIVIAVEEYQQLYYRPGALKLEGFAST